MGRWPRPNREPDRHRRPLPPSGGFALNMSATTIEFYAVALPAVLLLGLAKGGLTGIGMAALPMMALVVPPLEAAAIMLPILMVQDVVSAWTFRRDWDAWNLKVLLPGAAAGVGAAYVLARFVAEAHLQIVIGCISILFAARQLFMQFRPRSPEVRRPGIVLGFLCGSASGFAGLLAHAGPPPFQMFVLPQRLPRDIYVGTSILFFAAVNWIKLAAFVALGQMTADNLAIAGTLMPAAIAAAFAGIYAVRLLSGPRFYVIVYGLLILVGAKLVWDGFRQVAAL